jgi:MYXO-CTERM domain-containing protein
MRSVKLTAAALAALAVAAPAASATISYPGAPAGAPAPEEERLDLRSADARDAALRAERRGTSLPPTWPLSPEVLRPTATATTSADGDDVPVLPIAAAGVALLAVGGGVAARRRTTQPRPQAPARA